MGSQDFVDRRSEDLKARDLANSLRRLPETLAALVTVTALPAPLSDLHQFRSDAAELVRGGISLAAYEATAIRALEAACAEVRTRGGAAEYAALVWASAKGRAEADGHGKDHLHPRGDDFAAAMKAYPTVSLAYVSSAAEAMALAQFRGAVCDSLRSARLGTSFEDEVGSASVCLQYLDVAAAARRLAREAAAPVLASYESQVKLAMSLGLTDEEAEVAVEERPFGR